MNWSLGCGTLLRTSDDDPSPAHCSRPDIQRIHWYYLKWLDEVPGIFEGVGASRPNKNKDSIS